MLINKKIYEYHSKKTTIKQYLTFHVVVVPLRSTGCHWKAPDVLFRRRRTQMSKRRDAKPKCPPEDTNEWTGFQEELVALFI